MRLLVSEVFLSFILIWIIRAQGVIACGKGIFDSSTWVLDLGVIIGVPSILIIGSGLLYVWCAKQAVKR